MIFNGQPILQFRFSELKNNTHMTFFRFFGKIFSILPSNDLEPVVIRPTGPQIQTQRPEKLKLYYGFVDEIEDFFLYLLNA